MILHKVKKQLIKRLNLSRLLWPNLANGLYCFNFHRIGEQKETCFDPCVFSCNESSFSQYLRFFKKNFHVVSLDEVIQLTKNNTPITEKLALITFDDGYSDNYHLAYPLLKEQHLSAAFFITTSLIGSNSVPWWDEIAWHVKQCEGKKIQLSLWDKAIEIDKPVSNFDIRGVLQKIKASPKNVALQLEELRKISGAVIPENERHELFMTWPQLQEMIKNDMNISAHSHTHQIFSVLSKQELDFELSESKALIENKLSTHVTSLSYPVGGSKTYNTTMYKAIEANGYDIAFSFQPFVNKHLLENRFALGRFSIDQAFNERNLKEMILSANVI